MIHFQVARARNWVPDVEWSAEDATRTEIDYLCRCVETALKAGATTINLPDTVGYATPEEYYQMFRTVMEKVPGSEKAIFSVHCHNDLGMAVGQLARRHPRRLPADRMHHQRHRRAGWQRRAGRGGDGHQDQGRRAALRARRRRHHAQPRIQAGGGRDLLPRAVQQGHRRAERLCARERHPPGRHAQAHADLRDHDAGVGGRVQDLAGDGQALGPQRLPLQAQGAGL